MPRGKGRPRRPPLTPEQKIEILDAASPGPEVGLVGSARDVARVMGVSRDTVRRLLSKYQPVADTLRALQRDHILGGWQYAYFQAFGELAALEDTTPTTLKDRRDHAAIRRDLHVAMGIATEKAMLLSGQPTQIVAGIHEVRSRMPELAARIAEIAKRLAAENTAENTSDTPNE